MKRRHFIRAATAGAATAAMPTWLDRAFAQRPDPDVALATVANAYRRAVSMGRPLFAIVIPEDDRLKYTWGLAWGEYLNHASDAQLWPLASAEVVAAPEQAMRRLFPSLVASEPFAVVVRSGGRVPDITPVDVDLTPSQEPDIELPSSAYHAKREAIAERQINQRIAAIGTAVDQALSSSAGPVNGRVRARMAAQVRTRLVQRPVPGSRWAVSGGCGTRIEGASNDSQMMACGMGHVPKRSARFLYFFATGR